MNAPKKAKKEKQENIKDLQLLKKQIEDLKKQNRKIKKK